MDKDKQILDIQNLSDGEYNLTVKNHSMIKGPRLIDKKAQRFVLISCVAGLLVMLAFFFLIVFFCNSSKTTVGTTINFKSIQEKSELTVLSICVNKTINENEADNDMGISASTTFSGKGTYTVDLGKSEFLVDNVRYILVIKTPRIQLNRDHFTLEYNNVKQNFFNNSFADNSIKDGVTMAEKHYKEAYSSIYKTIISNPHFYSNAESAAKRLIENYAKSINQDIPDLKVIVEIGAI